LDVRVCHRLAEYDAIAQVVIAAKEFGGMTAAEVTVGAAAIDVKAAWGILREAVFNVGHI